MFAPLSEKVELLDIYLSERPGDIVPIQFYLARLSRLKNVSHSLMQLSVEIKPWFGQFSMRTDKATASTRLAGRDIFHIEGSESSELRQLALLPARPFIHFTSNQ